MQFRRVGPTLIDQARGNAIAGDRTRADVTAASAQTHATVGAFVSAWMDGDRTRLERLSTPDITTRWTGFDDGPVTARGLDEMIVLGRRFEERFGRAARYSMVDTLGGAEHGAILFELDGAGSEPERVARIAVYRVRDDRVAAITVYLDRAD